MLWGRIVRSAAAFFMAISMGRSHARDLEARVRARSLGVASRSSASTHEDQNGHGTAAIRTPSHALSKTARSLSIAAIRRLSQPTAPIAVGQVSHLLTCAHAARSEPEPDERRYCAQKMGITGG